VTVVATRIGQCLGAEAEHVYENSTTPRLLVWEITVDGRCARRGYAFCPGTLGDAPALVADASSLQYKLSPYERQPAPKVLVSEAVKGTMGNLLTSSKGNEIIELAVVHEHLADVEVGMKETQKLRCAGHGNFSLSMLNNVTGLWEVAANVSATSAPSNIRYALEALPGVGSITIRDDAAQGSVCCANETAAGCEWIYIDFEDLDGTLPLLEIGNEYAVHVEVAEVVKGIDSLEYAGGGHYTLVYTPTIAGNYTFSLAIAPAKSGGTNSTTFVATELSAGLVVSPAAASAAHSHCERRRATSRNFTFRRATASGTRANPVVCWRRTTRGRRSEPGPGGGGPSTSPSGACRKRSRSATRRASSLLIGARPRR